MQERVRAFGQDSKGNRVELNRGHPVKDHLERQAMLEESILVREERIREIALVREERIRALEMLLREIAERVPE